MFNVGDEVVRVSGSYGRMQVGDKDTVLRRYRGSSGTNLELKKFGLGHSSDSFEVVAKAAPKKGQAGGLKFDAGKDEWNLLLSGKGMIKALRGVVGILMFGAKKYAAHSWREVEHNERRYLDGLMRHYAAIMEHGLQARDEESGLLHIDHLNCNGLFLGEIARAQS